MQLLPPFPLDANDTLEVAAARESLRIRASQSIQVRVPLLLAIAAAAVGFSLAVPVWRVLAWGVPVAFLALLNAHVAKAVLRDLDQAEAPALARWQAVLWWKTVVNHALMATMVWWVGYGEQSSLATVATALQLIFIGGSLINASTHPPSVVAGSWVNLGMTAVYWMVQSSQGVVMAFALLGMGLVVAKACERSAEAFRESLRMRFENADLVRKLAQEKRSAEEANAAKSRFLAAASHDLRQPLHALLVFSTLLHKTRTPQTAELIEHIRSAAGSLDKLFAGLLDLSKLETGGIAAQMQAVNVTAILAELVKEYRGPCEDKGIAMEFEGPVQWVLSDPFLLERVLRNLIDNAVKYTARGTVLVRVEEGLSQCIVSVTDTGEGIAPEMQARIFEEYFQADNPARDLSKGSGLGLAIVKRLCGLMDTPLEMSSEPGRGSCFTLVLQQAPIDDAIGATGQASGPAVPRGALAGRAVWVVEDNELVRLATRKALADMGCDVSDWPALPDDVERLPAPHAVIADYRLGEHVNGLQVARRLRQRWPGLPIAIMTGDPSIDKDAIASIEGLILLRKPVLPALLERWLHEVGRPAQAGAAAPDQAILTP